MKPVWEEALRAILPGPRIEHTALRAILPGTRIEHTALLPKCSLYSLARNPIANSDKKYSLEQMGTLMGMQLLGRASTCPACMLSWAQSPTLQTTNQPMSNSKLFYGLK